MLSREVPAKNKIILLVWHRLKAQDILKYSPYLADKFAITTDVGLDELAFRIVEIVKPDIVNSMALLQAFRYTLKNSGVVMDIPIRDIKLNKNEIRHKVFPKYFMVSTKLIHSIFADVLRGSYEEYITDFARDADYEQEFLIWNAMASTYIDFIISKRIDFRDIEIKRGIIRFLLGATAGVVRNIEKYQQSFPTLSLDDYKELLVIYKGNHDALMTIISLIDID